MSRERPARPGPVLAGDVPLRPSVSPLLWAGAAAWAGSWLGTELAMVAWSGRLPHASVVGWVVALACAGWCALARHSRARFPAAAVAVGLAAALLHGGWVAGAATRAAQAGLREWSGVVCADARRGAMGTSVTVRLDNGPVPGTRCVISWPEDREVPAYGRIVKMSARLKSADPSKEWAAAAFRRGEIVRGSPWRVEDVGWAPQPLGAIAAWRQAALARLKAIGGDGADVVASMLFADRGATAGTAAEEDARTAGVAWALVASGLHLGVAVLLAERSAGMLGFARRGRAVAALAALAVFALAAGLRVSLMRAALVATTAALARLVGRRRDGTAAVGLAVLVLVIVDPVAASDVGLLLGVLAVTAISLFGGLGVAWIRPLTGQRLARSLGSSVVAQLAVAPVSASLFGAVGLLGPVALAVSVPAIQAAVVIGCAGSLVLPVWTAGGTVALKAAAVAASAALLVWRTVARLPGAAVPVAAVTWWAWVLWAAAFPMLWLWWPRPRRSARTRAVALLGAVVLTVCLLVPAPVRPGITVLDIGQGDAILVRDGGHTLLVDTGPDAASLRRALARARVGALDGLVLTHAHADHIGGLAGLAGIARPGWIGVPDVEDPAIDALVRDCGRRADAVVRLRRDMTWQVGETRVRVLWPCGGERRLDANDTSVVLLLERSGERALLLGDAEERAQRGALRAFAQGVDVLKVAHHGSPNGNVPAALAVWSPPLALISVGEGNRFGHPSRTALASLAEIGARVRRTDLEGDLACPLDADVPSAVAAAKRVWAVGVCDNLRYRRPPPRPHGTPDSEAGRWPQASLPTSSRSTSSTAPRSCCSSGRSNASGIAWPPSPTSTSTSRRSTASRAPPTTSSTPPTRCPS